MNDTFEVEPSPDDTNPVEAQIDDVVAELSSMSERLNDLAMDALRHAVESGSGRRPDVEKRLSSARRSIDKAIRTLDRGATDRWG